MGLNQSVAFRAGVRDWLIQRASAVVMVGYIFTIIFWLSQHSQVNYDMWSGLFATTWMKVFTVLFMLSLCLHAWVGLWTIFTDYVKIFVLRMVLNFAVLLVLAGYFVWTIQIVWRI